MRLTSAISCTYVDWVRRFLDYAAQQQGVPHPRVATAVVRDYLTHLAVHRRVSASTQNQALSAVLFLYRLRGTPRNRHYVSLHVTLSASRTPADLLPAALLIST